MFFLLFALLIGIGVPVQTAVNSRLRSYVLSPFVASLISFTVGMTFLGIATLLTKGTLLFPASLVTEEPAWLWIGGLLGVIGLTGNILLFPKLGGVQTVLLPIMGQIIASMLIDTFGLFNSLQQPFTVMRGVGVLILVVGLICIVVLPDVLNRRKRGMPAETQGSKLPFQLFGILAGMMMATQAPINGHLGSVLHSPIHAAFISFTVGMIILLLIVTLGLRKLPNVKLAFGQGRPWWILTGGLIGSIFVLGMATLVPIVGTGLVVIVGLFGQILCSMMIDQFGLLGAKKTSVTGIQLLGILLMIIGVILIEVF
ncbi:DMT family transporter [Macrococcus equipercicus]|uniref:DMT family transporter n=1 Tax=Macrococcus equipercicus TaxID=69967 RepID=UPI0020B83DD7|nr:DMT family transporter [Macrococcus equipercicus]